MRYTGRSCKDVLVLSTKLLFLLTALFSQRLHAEWFQDSFNAMTTRVSLTFWSETQKDADAIKQGIRKVFADVDRDMNRYDPESELSRMNRKAATKKVTVSPALFRVLLAAQMFAKMSDGAFDATFASSGYLYDFRSGKQPTEGQLQAHSGISYQDVALDPENRGVSYNKSGIIIDLGGIAKGYAVDQGIELMISHGVRSARLSAGGDMRLLGDKRGRPWIVGIKDPRSENNAVRLPLQDVAVSTSGDYERFFIDENGERVHHIISPRSGRPAKGIQSVTIIGDVAMSTDALSTAVFVRGVESGIALINSQPGVDAIIIDSDRKMHYSSGLGAPEK